MASKPARSLSHRLLALDDLKTGLSDAFNRLKRKGDGEPEKLFLESAEKDKRICIYVVSDEKKTIRVYGRTWRWIVGVLLIFEEKFGKF
eukprot:1356607-Amorphochlora_amoeboformis.AAC.1